jgi:tetratricopeptide (TPR) repeat protein
MHYLRRGMLHYKMRDYDRAKGYFAAALEDRKLTEGNRGECFYHIAKILHQQGNVEEAKKSYEQARSRLKDEARRSDEFLSPPGRKDETLARLGEAQRLCLDFGSVNQHKSLANE